MTVNVGYLEGALQRCLEISKYVRLVNFPHNCLEIWLIFTKDKPVKLISQIFFLRRL